MHAQSPQINGAVFAANNGDERAFAYVRAYYGAFEGNFALVADAIRAFGCPEDRAQVIAEWQAAYHHRDYSVYPRYAAPRMPRPLGETEED